MVNDVKKQDNSSQHLPSGNINRIKKQNIFGLFYLVGINGNADMPFKIGLNRFNKKINNF